MFRIISYTRYNSYDAKLEIDLLEKATNQKLDQEIIGIVCYTCSQLFHLGAKMVSESNTKKISKASKATGKLGDMPPVEPAKTLKPVEIQEEGLEEAWIPFGCIQCGMGPDPARAHVVNGVLAKVEGNPKFREQWPSPSLICAAS